MKIAVVGTRGVPNLMGGIETHCEELYPRIAQRGYDITVYRRRGYVYDNLIEYQGCHLVDVDTPKIKSLEVIVHTFKAILMAKKMELILYISMLSGLHCSLLLPDGWE